MNGGRPRPIMHGEFQSCVTETTDIPQMSTKNNKKWERIFLNDDMTSEESRK